MVGLCDKTDRIIEYIGEIEEHLSNIEDMARKGTLPDTIDEDKVEMWRQKKLNEISAKLKVC